MASIRMHLFPKAEMEFELIDTQDETLSRLKRRTEHSENLISKHTDRSFIGKIEGTSFKIISSAIGRGAFCVMTGQISSDHGYVKVEIHRAFKVLLSIILSLPVIGMIIEALSKGEVHWLPLIPIVVGQILIIRFLFIGLMFRLLSKSSLDRLRDVADLKWKHQ